MNKIKSLVYRNSRYTWKVESNGEIKTFTVKIGKEGIYQIHKDGGRMLLRNYKKVLLRGKFSEDIRKILQITEPCVLSNDLKLDIK